MDKYLTLELTKKNTYFNFLFIKFLYIKSFQHVFKCLPLGDDDRLVSADHDLPDPGPHVVVAGHGADIGASVQDGQELA